MFENVAGIKIKDAIFDEETILELFKEKKKIKNTNKYSYSTTRASILYGKNGTGKSTLSRAVNNLKMEERQTEMIEFTDLTGNKVSLDSMNEKIFVFNEEFIDKNIKFTQEGLDTIVILGKDNEIDEKIEVLESKKIAIENDLASIEALQSEYEDKKNKKSPHYWLEFISNKLKGTNNWAERDREIRENRQASPVHYAKTYKYFIKLLPNQSRDSLLLLFENKKKEYFNKKQTNTLIDTPVKKINRNFRLKELSGQLNKKLEKPELTGREKMIFKILSDNEKGEKYLQEIKILFKEKDTETCPFCLQSVSLEYKNSLIDSIEKILSDIVKEHERELAEYQIEDIIFDFQEYKDLDKAKVDDCIKSLSILNQEIAAINNLIGQKKNNPYNPILFDDTKFNTILDNFNDTLFNLEQERNIYNSSINELEKLKEDLISLNNQIAYYDIKVPSENYEKQNQEQVTNQEQLTTKLKEKKDIDNEIQLLKTKKEGTEIAMDVINFGLKYIFFSETRLSIKSNRGKYYVYSRGKSVSPDKISIGERNAIAICYYFTEILKNKEISTGFNEEYFLLIDDPISSFDMENKVGMISYLKYSLKRFISGNKQTKILLLTHDRQTFYDFSKFMDEIMDYCKENEVGGKPAYKKFELINGKIREFSQKESGYTVILENIYEFILDEDIESQGIGNGMRKILEAFSSFMYKEGIEKITTNNRILGKLSNIEHQIYFENLMYRLVLHGDSHYEDDVKTMNVNFFDYISDEEKRKTCKDLLVLMFLLNDLHVLTHLRGKKNAEINLNMWSQEILNN